MDLKVQWLLHDVECIPKINNPGTIGIRLPKISVSFLDRNLLNWTSFWEHFDGAVHNRHGLQDVENLVYLKVAVKESPTRYVIEGLS